MCPFMNHSDCAVVFGRFHKNLENLESLNYILVDTVNVVIKILTESFYSFFLIWFYKKSKETLSDTYNYIYKHWRTLVRYFYFVQKYITALRGCSFSLRDLREFNFTVD